MTNDELDAIETSLVNGTINQPAVARLIMEVRRLQLGNDLAHAGKWELVRRRLPDKQWWFEWKFVPRVVDPAVPSHIEG